MVKKPPKTLLLLYIFERNTFDCKRIDLKLKSSIDNAARDQKNARLAAKVFSRLLFSLSLKNRH